MCSLTSQIIVKNMGLFASLDSGKWGPKGEHFTLF